MSASAASGSGTAGRPRAVAAPPPRRVEQAMQAQAAAPQAAGSLETQNSLLKEQLVHSKVEVEHWQSKVSAVEQENARLKEEHARLQRVQTAALVAGGSGDAKPPLAVSEPSGAPSAPPAAAGGGRMAAPDKGERPARRELQTGVKSSASSGTYTWEVSGLSAIKERLHYSPVFEIGGWQWRLIVETPFGDGAATSTHLGLYLESHDSREENGGHTRVAKFTLTVIEQEPDDDDVELEDISKADMTHRFTPSSVDWGYTQFVSRERLEDPDYYYVQGDKLVVEVDLAAMPDWDYQVPLTKEEGESEESFVARQEFEQAEMLRKVDDYAEALSHYTLAIEKGYSHVALAHNQRGICYEKLGQHEEALADYNEAVRLKPSDAVMWTNRAWEHKQLGRIEQAEDDLNKALELDGEYTVASDKLEEVKAELRKIAMDEFDKARELYMKKDEEAVVALTDVLHMRHADRATVHNSRGCSFINLQKYNEAFEDFDQSIKLDANCSVFFSNRGLAYEKLGKPDKAEKDYKYAVELDPENPDYRDRLAKVQTELAMSVAMKIMDQYGSAGPEAAMADSALATASSATIAQKLQEKMQEAIDVSDQLHAKGKHEDAISSWTTVLVQLNEARVAGAPISGSCDGAQVSRCHMMRGQSHRALKQIREAEADFSKAIQMDPKNTKASKLLKQVQKELEAKADAFLLELEAEDKKGPAKSGKNAKKKAKEKAKKARLREQEEAAQRKVEEAKAAQRKAQKAKNLQKEKAAAEVQEAKKAKAAAQVLAKREKEAKYKQRVEEDKQRKIRKSMNDLQEQWRDKLERREIEPCDCYCPMTLELMRNPVLDGLGHNYERSSIQEWLMAHDTSPSTNEPLPHKVVVINDALKQVCASLAIQQQWKKRQDARSSALSATDAAFPIRSLSSPVLADGLASPKQLRASGVRNFSPAIGAAPVRLTPGAEFSQFTRAPGNVAPGGGQQPALEPWQMGGIDLGTDSEWRDRQLLDMLEDDTRSSSNSAMTAPGSQFASGGVFDSVSSTASSFESTASGGGAFGGGSAFGTGFGAAPVDHNPRAAVGTGGFGLSSSGDSARSSGGGSGIWGGAASGGGAFGAMGGGMAGGLGNLRSAVDWGQPQHSAQGSFDGAVSYGSSNSASVDSTMRASGGPVSPVRSPGSNAAQHGHPTHQAAPHGATSGSVESIARVSSFLETLGLSKYSSSFSENEIDWEAMKLLKDDDLRDLGLSLGARKKMLHQLTLLPPDA